MRKKTCIIIALSALIAAVSCQKSPEFPGTPELDGGGIKLEFTCGSQSTKATMPGDDEYHENTLTTIDYFLYPEGQTGNRSQYRSGVPRDQENHRYGYFR